MTMNVAKPGCISKSLDKFLKLPNDKKRKHEYGNIKAAKYYERIVTEVKASFVVHQNVVTKLPDEHLKKINFMTEYNILMNLLIGKKLYSQPPSLLVKETIEQLNAVKYNIALSAKFLQPLVQPDFDKVLQWLKYIQEQQIFKQKIVKKKTVKK